MSSQAKREQVAFAMEQGQSKRIACELIGAARSTLCSDNGPEFISKRILEPIVESKIEIAHIDPGKPWQNGADESLGGRLGDECRSLKWFRSRLEARVIIGRWRRHYNEVRPHASLGHRTLRGIPATSRFPSTRSRFQSERRSGGAGQALRRGPCCGCQEPFQVLEAVSILERPVRQSNEYLIKNREICPRNDCLQLSLLRGGNVGVLGGGCGQHEERRGRRDGISFH